MPNEHQTGLVLLFRIRRRLAAIPIARVAETMRPLPIEALAGAPPFVKGVSVIRGSPAPVVDAGSLVGERVSSATRLVTLKIAGRTVALAVDEVVGVRPLAAESMRSLPALLRDTGTDVLEAIGAFDEELLLVLRDARIVPDSVWAGAGSQSAPG